MKSARWRQILKRDIKQEPVSKIEWILRERLNPNDYNPNHVAPPELKLLIHSLVEDGWTQPIVCLPDLTIVDGYHRWLVSGREPLLELYGGMVPVVVISVDAVHRKMSTVRHNRARGEHAILPMAEIVTSMLADGVPSDRVMAGLGMEDEELVRLSTHLGMPDIVGVNGFGKSWIPGVKAVG